MAHASTAANLIQQEGTGCLWRQKTENGQEGESPSGIHKPQRNIELAANRWAYNKSSTHLDQGNEDHEQRGRTTRIVVCVVLPVPLLRKHLHGNHVNHSAAIKRERWLWLVRQKRKKLPLTFRRTAAVGIECGNRSPMWSLGLAGGRHTWSCATACHSSVTRERGTMG